MHREHTCFLLSNLALNSLAETLKIMNNEGLVKRLVTIVDQEKDSKVIYEALYCIKIISSQLAKDKSEAKRANQVQLYSEVKTDQNLNLIRVMAKSLSRHKTPGECCNVILALEILQDVFSYD